MFTLTIKTDNAAFHDDGDEDNEGARNMELARILREVAGNIADGAPDSGRCTMRRVRAEIIEDCAKIAQEHGSRLGEPAVGRAIAEVIRKSAI